MRLKILSSKIKILITDAIHRSGTDKLKEAGFQIKEDYSLNGKQLKEEISGAGSGKGYDGLIVRSGTEVTEDIIKAGGDLKVIGRAGKGVDNIDLEAATRSGVLVMNVPAGNTLSACEHTWALILSLVRNVPFAHQALSDGRWEKKKYKGSELYGKTLGIIGFGKIGLSVATRAKSFNLDIVVYDPYLSEEKASQYGVEKVDFEELLSRSDIVTIHVPGNKKTEDMIDSDALNKMKNDAFFINCARGSVVNEQDLAEAVKKGEIRGAAVDVYKEEPVIDSPLISTPGIVHTPHLGAATLEAQKRVAVQMATQVIDYFKRDKIKNAVNTVSMDIEESLKKLAQNLGSLCGSLAENLTDKVLISYISKQGRAGVEVIKQAAMTGYLSQFNEGINYINSKFIAREKGVEIVTQTSSKNSPFDEVIIELNNGLKVSGKIIGDTPRLTGINKFIIDIPLSGRMLILENKDKPGVIGKLGTLLGEKGINIGNMEVGRKDGEDTSITIVGVDQKIPAQVLQEISNIKDIIKVNSFVVGP
ncbi:MAG: phosphoglycerate dehydrogenase [Elusimicrobiota bacterium]